MLSALTEEEEEASAARFADIDAIATDSPLLRPRRRMFSRVCYSCPEKELGFFAACASCFTASLREP